MSENQRWNWMKQELGQLKERSLYRELYSTTLLDHGWIEREGRKMLNLASNDYLGLNQQKVHFLDQLQTGSTASRLIVGSDPIYREFERDFALYKGTESCLLFSSGYMANLGVISALMGRNDAVFSDRLNHASITDGIMLSRAEHRRYRHRDLEQLEELLSKAKPEQKKLIITDSIFSMDGDIAPLKALVELKNRYGAILMVDEAHSGGLYGNQGQGLACDLGLTDEIDIHMGTFSKAYGCYGAYIAGDSILIDYLINKARSFIYTTALPPMNIFAIEKNWNLVKTEQWRRDKLRKLCTDFREKLNNCGFSTGQSETQIIPLMIGDNHLAMEYSQRLRQEGIAAVAIRPPTVPEGTARIRFTLMSEHQIEDLDWAVTVIEHIGRELGVI
jgi:8-amino-7-oxononanoate synthase